jgi:hypothetical protein
MKHCVRFKKKKKKLGVVVTMWRALGSWSLSVGSHQPFTSSYNTTNKMHLLSQIIYSCKTLYMFRTVFPFIIRSSKLRIQQPYVPPTEFCKALQAVRNLQNLSASLTLGTSYKNIEFKWSSVSDKKKWCCGYNVTRIRLLEPISRISPTIPLFL